MDLQFIFFRGCEYLFVNSMFYMLNNSASKYGSFLNGKCTATELLYVH